MKLVNVVDAQSNLSSLLEEAESERIVIAREGHPVGVLLSLTEYQEWARVTDEEIDALFSSPELHAKPQRADADDAAGRWIADQEVKKALFDFDIDAFVTRDDVEAWK